MGYDFGLWRLPVTPAVVPVPAAPLPDPPVEVHIPPPARAAGDPKAPRGIRNNNPLNIEHHTANAWHGLDTPPSDGRFCRFLTMAYGCRAAALLLRTHWNRGNRTPETLIAIWAPEDENDTQAYVRSVIQFAGLKPGVLLNLDSSSQLVALIGAMARVENGREISQVSIVVGVDLALDTRNA